MERKTDRTNEQKDTERKKKTIIVKVRKTERKKDLTKTRKTEKTKEDQTKVHRALQRWQVIPQNGTRVEKVKSGYKTENFF